MPFDGLFYQYNPDTMPSNKTAFVGFGFSIEHVGQADARNDRVEFLNAHLRMQAFCNFLKIERPDITQFFVIPFNSLDGVEHPVGFEPNENAVSIKSAHCDRIRLSDIPISSDVTHFLLAGNCMLSCIQNFGRQVLADNRDFKVSCVSDCSVSSTNSRHDDLGCLFNDGIFPISGTALIGSNNMPPRDSLITSQSLLRRFSAAAEAVARRVTELTRGLHL